MRRPVVVVAAVAAVLCGGAFAAQSPRSDYAGKPSPDGRWILFEKIYPHNRYEGPPIDLWVTDIDGTHVRRLAEPRTNGWSHEWTIGGLVSIADTPNARLVDPRNGTTVRRAPVPSPIWSPDGTSIAYVNDYSIFIARSDGSGARIVAEAPPVKSRWLDRPTWSPDSSRLAYTVGVADGKGALELVNRDGSGQRRVRTAGSISAASWSPDSRRLAFTEQAAGKGYQPRHVYLANASGNGVRLFAGGESYHPRWSPNGRWILYDRTVRKARDDVEQVVLRRQDGSGTHVLTRPRGLSTWRSAYWLPVGTRLVVTALGPCRFYGVYTIGVDGRNAVRLTNRC